MNRRSFMSVILATATAPAFVKAGSIMRVNPRIVRPRYVVLGVDVSGKFGDGWDIGSYVYVTDIYGNRLGDPEYREWRRGRKLVNLLDNGRMSNEVWL